MQGSSHPFAPFFFHFGNSRWSALEVYLSNLVSGHEREQEALCFEATKIIELDLLSESLGSPLVFIEAPI